jgi:hypothetical protein
MERISSSFSIDTTGEDYYKNNPMNSFAILETADAKFEKETQLFKKHLKIWGVWMTANLVSLPFNPVISVILILPTAIEIGLACKHAYQGGKILKEKWEARKSVDLVVAKLHDENPKERKVLSVN